MKSNQKKMRITIYLSFLLSLDQFLENEVNASSQFLQKSDVDFLWGEE